MNKPLGLLQYRGETQQRNSDVVRYICVVMFYCQVVFLFWPVKYIMYLCISVNSFNTDKKHATLFRLVLSPLLPYNLDSFILLFICNRNVAITRSHTSKNRSNYSPTLALNFMGYVLLKILLLPLPSVNTFCWQKRCFFLLTTNSAQISLARTSIYLSIHLSISNYNTSTQIKEEREMGTNFPDHVLLLQVLLGEAACLRLPVTAARMWSACSSRARYSALTRSRSRCCERPPGGLSPAARTTQSG